jgi:hypothetical protein
MFGQSVSWQNDRFIHKVDRRKYRYLTCRDALSSSQSSSSQSSLWKTHHLFFERFLAFVPSLSWQKDHFRIKISADTKERFPHLQSPPLAPPPVCSPSTLQAETGRVASPADVTVSEACGGTSAASALPARKRIISFFRVLSLCLSRACLGKMIPRHRVSYKIWRYKNVFLVLPR